MTTYLVDTNIWLERLLGQERSEAVGKFLATVPITEMALSDFALHSIAIILLRRGYSETLADFLQDVVVEAEVSVLSVAPSSLHSVVDLVQKSKLDFDDAYQYVIANNYDLTIVSYDTDFNPTERGRTTPQQVLAALTDDHDEMNEDT